MHNPSLTTDSLIAEAERLEADEQFDDAIALLTAENEREPRQALEEQLLGLRNRAFYKHVSPSPEPVWPPKVDGGAPATHEIPETRLEGLTAAQLRTAIFTRGALIVRSVLDADEVASMSEAITSAFEAGERYFSGGDNERSPWYAPFAPREGEIRDGARHFAWAGSGVLGPDSPRGFFRLVQIIKRHGLDQLIGGFLGERPALSVQKTTLRTVKPDLDTRLGWHQDGAFLGKGIRTINLWMALTDCGVTAPSMEMVPARLYAIVPTGTEGAAFSWSVSTEMAENNPAGAKPVMLQFKAGDAIFFDEMNLHRTAALPGMTQSRKAIEAWFFAPSCYPPDKTPMLV